MNNKRVNTISLFLFADDSNLFRGDKDAHILECQLNKEGGIYLCGWKLISYL